MSGLDNGLARTPPMGWMSWVTFNCITHCNKKMDNCISETLFMQMADKMATEGYKEAGYDTIVIDDCWMDRKRTHDGKLQPDQRRFPHGMKALAEYVHKRGLKFGIYGDIGTQTCQHYPGSRDHLEIDAKTFAEWGADYVKMDGCHANPGDMDRTYPEFGRYLNQTGRRMVYSCSWPYYQYRRNYKSIAEHCNLWRNYNDVFNSWQKSVLGIINYYGDDRGGFGQFAGPGHWNDPDMLVVGNHGISLDQARAQMGMWCMLASPLLMSADLRTIRREFKEILLNKNLIKLNQDKLGVQAKRIYKGTYIDVFSRPLSPDHRGKQSVAVAFLNRKTAGAHRAVFRLSDLGLKNKAGYRATDIFSGKSIGSFKPEDTFKHDVNPTGILLVKFSQQK